MSCSAKALRNGERALLFYKQPHAFHSVEGFFYEKSLEVRGLDNSPSSRVIQNNEDKQCKCGKNQKNQPLSFPKGGRATGSFSREMGKLWLS